jgi:outer membrane protein TolC
MKTMRDTVWVILWIVLLISASISCASSQEIKALTLQDALIRALARNELVRTYEQAVENARLSLVQTRTHTPTLSLNSSHSESSTGGLDPESEITGTKSSSQGYSTSVYVPIDAVTNLSIYTSGSTYTTNSSLRTGGGLGYTYAGVGVGIGLSHQLGLFRNERLIAKSGRWYAEMSLQNAELALEEARRMVVSDIQQKFFTALRAQHQVEILQASQAETEEVLSITREKLALGKVPEIDVMDAQINADAARTNVSLAQANVQGALDQLKNRLGMPLEQALTLADDRTTESTPAQDEAALLQQAVNSRIDMKQLAMQIKSAEMSLKLTKANTRPSVALSAGYDRSGQGSTISESFRKLINPSWSVGIGTSMSLNNAADRAEIAQAEGALRMARLDERLAKDDLRLEIRQLLRNTAAAQANMALLAENVKRAEESLRVHRVRMERGLDTPLDISQSEHQLESIRQNFADAQINQQLTIAQLRLAIGEMPVSGLIDPSKQAAIK